VRRPLPSDPAYAWMRRIRNLAKRDYAERYLGWTLGIYKAEPERPASLSYMAAQAVRLRLSELLEAAK
jgi:hypothetical protein